MAVTNDAKIWAFIAQSGMGKGVLMKAALRKLKPKRIIILDTKDENGEFGEMVPSLVTLAKGSFQPGFKLRYRLQALDIKGRKAEFQAVCRIASAAGNCVFMIEELGRYTTPSYAPPAWADCCNDGRHDGLHIIVASQFPAQLDKSLMGNATEIWCGHLGEEPHRVVMARKMDVDQQQIKDLQKFQFLHYDRDARTVRQVVAKIPR
ncbi:hypothetical protein [Undibacterium sp. Ren11W]|uniref:hypothetical protein n=1 Tax=Undibacterium sp. Ren11W TaxID=3413045 RepID=UPI003BF1A458